MLASAHSKATRNFSLIVWQPSGKLLPVQIEKDMLRSTVEISVIEHGNADDLFIYPITASLLEVPEMDGQVWIGRARARGACLCVMAMRLCWPDVGQAWVCLGG